MAERTNPKRLSDKATAAHYKALAAAAKRMQDMGHSTASGGKPPKEGCWDKLVGGFIAIIMIGATFTAALGDWL